MLSLFRAEWIKINSNRLAAGLFVWVFPVSALVFLIFAAIAAAASEIFRAQIQAAPPNWIDQALVTWGLTNSELGRFMLVIFTADAFGGEYQRSMWKNLLPRRRRAILLLNKFLVIGVIVVIAFSLMSLISAVLSGVVVNVAGASYGPAITGEVIVDFLGKLGTQAFVSLTAALVAASYAALGGIFTRSILGAVVIGGACTLLEQAILLVLFLLGSLFQAPGLIGVYQFTPGYNLANLSSWGKSGVGYTLPFLTQNGFSEFSAATSTLIIAVWVIGLIGLTLYLFRRQDIMS